MKLSWLLLVIFAACGVFVWLYSVDHDPLHTRTSCTAPFYDRGSEATDVYYALKETMAMVVRYRETTGRLPSENWWADVASMPRTRDRLTGWMSRSLKEAGGTLVDRYGNNVLLLVEPANADSTQQLRLVLLSAGKNRRIEYRAGSSAAACGDDVFYDKLLVPSIASGQQLR